MSVIFNSFPPPLVPDPPEVEQIRPDLYAVLTIALKNIKKLEERVKAIEGRLSIPDKRSPLFTSLYAEEEEAEEERSFKNVRERRKAAEAQARKEWFAKCLSWVKSLFVKPT